MTEVLVVDDEAPMREALEASFRRGGWRVMTASGVGDALAKFKNAPCGLVVTDMRMQDGDGLAVMRGVREVAPETAVIFLTAYGTVPEAVQTIKRGAWDYLMKPVSFEQLTEAARRILGRETAKGNGPAWDLIGRCPEFSSLLSKARHIARTDTEVLIEAESGTGKELLARFIHRESLRASGPFVAVNCSAVPESLLESELFGHVRGAFTGATCSKLGKFEVANGGTLLLDEIGDMPLSLQPKLLRVLQEREVDRLGDTRPIPLDVRVIATTNRALKARLESGEFRADLYYRLNVVPLSIPPLRERREDILVLAEYFLRKYEPEAQKGQFEISPELAAALVEHAWPGNVRELENCIRRALALTHGPILGRDLFEPSAPASPAKPGTTLEEVERQLLENTLRATGGNRTRAAALMGVSLRTVRNKIREYGLSPRRVS